MFIKLNRKILKKSLTQAGINDKVEAVEVIETFKNYIKNTFGEQALKYINPLYIKDKILVVQTTDSFISAQLKNKEGEIISFINRRENYYIKRLRFTV